MLVLKVKDIASRETEGRVHTNDLENTLGSAFLQGYEGRVHTNDLENTLGSAFLQGY